MTAKILVDTNVLVYAYDSSAGKKHQTACDIVKKLWESGQGVLSIQVLQEFFVTVVKKIPHPIDEVIASEIIKDLMHWKVVNNDGNILLGAINIKKRYQFSFWDSLIVEAAVSSGANILLTEDLSHQQSVNGLLIQNPFTN